MKKFELFFTFVLLPIDILMIILAFALSFGIRNNFEGTVLPLRDYLHYAIIFLPVYLLVIAGNGLYHVKNDGGSFLNEFIKIVNATAVAIFLLILAVFLSHNLGFSRLIIILAWFFNILTLSAGRLFVKIVQRSLLRHGIGTRSLILIGDNSISDEIIEQLSANSGYIVKGILNEHGDNSRFGLRVIGSFEDLPQIVKKIKVDEVVLTDANLSKRKTMEIIETCSDNNLTFKYVPEVFSLVSLNFSSELIGSIQAMELKSIPLDGWGRIIKRILDILFSLIFLIILSPIFLIIAILIKLTSKGQVIYANKRVGRDEKPFNFYKFRSMYSQHCDYTAGTKWSTKEDEKTRITPFGLILRKTNIDELPQLWNILKGDMSFVGPRPEFPKIVAKFEKEIPDYFRRHRVKAGLTGWAQVNGLKGDTSIRDRVRYDIYYIENWSLWFDIRIIIKTFWLVIYETFAGKYEYRSRS